MAGMERLVVVALQQLFQLRRELVEIVVEPLEAAVLRDQLRSRLFANAWHPGDVVGGIALQSLEVYQPRRQYPVSLLYLLLAVKDGVAEATPGSQYLDPRRHELQGVRVPGEDHHVQPLLHGLPGKGSQYVVGFETVQMIGGDAHGIHELVDAGELFDQPLRRGTSLGLVGIELPVAKRRDRGVEGCGDVFGVQVVQHLEQHGGYAVGGVDELASGAGQQGKGVERAMNQCVAVYQNDPRRHRASLRSTQLTCREAVNRHRASKMKSL